MLLDDFLVAENSPFQSDLSSPILSPDRASSLSSPRFNQPNLSSFGTSPTSDDGQEFSSSGSMRSDSITLSLIDEQCGSID